ncbi:MAG TPA: LPS export ABC transporter permease LptF [Burkholderiaceae bacterium]
MIFQRALQRELASTVGAVFTALFTISITWVLIKMLGEAAMGKIATADVLALIGFKALNYLPIMLILTSFISVLLVITRSYQDSEMVVWFASGVSLTQWIRPVLTTGLPVVLLTALLSFFLTPWANQKSAEFIDRFQKREDLARVSPGKFQESSSANRIFFVEGVSGDASHVQNIFVNTVKDGKTTIIVAKEGTIETDARGDKFLIMQKGRRYEGQPSQADFQMMEFERYKVLVAKQSNVAASELKTKALSTLALIRTADAGSLGEVLWRIGQPFMCLLLMLLAIPLGFVNPRAGRSANVIIAILLSVTYLNMVGFMQAGVTNERFSFAMAWWPLHIIAAIAIAALFAWRLNVNHRFHPLVLLSMRRRAAVVNAGGST